MRTVNPEQHARKRAAILYAAAQEFAEHGVDGTSTASICRRAGIGSGTLFHYFATKRAIFHALFGDDLARNVEVCERAVASEDPAAGLDLLLAHLVADLGDPLTPGLMAAALFQAHRDEKFALLLIADEERTRTAFTALLERMVAAGATLPFPPDRVAGWIQTTIDASYLATQEDTDAQQRIGELRRVVAWLTGRHPA